MSRRKTSKRQKTGRKQESRHARREHSTRRRGLMGRALRWALVALVSILIALLARFYLHSTVPVSFSAALSTLGDAAVSYATRQSQSYSPACGCMADKNERFRGITFAARRLRVSNTQPGPATAYWLMASEPAQLTWYPNMVRPQVRVLRIATSFGTTPSVEQFETGRGAGLRLLAENSYTEDLSVALVTSEPLDLYLSGSVPIAAYIPVDRSRVSIIQPERTFGTDWDPSIIRDDYDDAPVPIDAPGHVIRQLSDLSYPILDAVGSKLIIVSRDSTTVAVSPKAVSEPPERLPANTYLTTVVVVNSPFSTRIAAIPYGSDRLPSAVHTTSQDSFQEFSKPNEPARPLEPGEYIAPLGGGPILLPTAAEDRRAGRFEIQILSSLDSAEYAAVAATLAQSDITTARNIRYSVPQLDHTGMDFRYPRIPPRNGFFVFGLLNMLSLNVERGRIMVGTSSVDIAAPSQVELRNIAAFSSQGNVVPIPFVEADSVRSFDFRMEATAELYVNASPVAVRADRFMILLQVASIASLVIGALAGIATLVTTLRAARV